MQRILRFCFLLVMMLTTAGLLKAQTTITSAQTGNWTDASTWVGGVVPVSGNNVVIAAEHTVTLVSNTDIGSGGFTVNGTLAMSIFSMNAGSLEGPGNITSVPPASPTLTVGSNNSSTTYSGVFSASARLTKVGTGTLTLTGANTYTGATTVSSGTLAIGDGVSTAAAIAGASIVNNATVQFNRPDSYTYAGVISGTGAVTKLGAGTLFFSGANTYTGATTISEGILSIGTGGSTGAISSSSNIVNNATLQINRINAYTYSGVISGTGSLVKLAAGTFTPSGANTYTGSTTIRAGTISISADNNLGAAPASPTPGHLVFNLISNSPTLSTTASFALNANRGINLATAGTISIASSTILSYGGIITGGAFTLTKAGAGVLNLSGANTYGGATLISAGTLQLGASGVIPDQSSISVNGTLDMNGFSEAVGPLAAGSTGLITSGVAGAVTIGTTNTGGVTFAGVIQNGSGVVSVTKAGAGQWTLSGSNTYTGSTTISAGTLSVTGTISGSSNIVNNAILTFTPTVSDSYPGIISGSGVLNKSGTGTLTLFGANTYTGNTNITGTLVAANSSALGTSPLVTVNANSTLQTDVSLSLNRISLNAAGGKFNCNGKNSTCNRIQSGNIILPSGTNGSTASAAQFKSDVYFTAGATGFITSNDCPFIVEVMTDDAGQTVYMPLLGNANVTVYWGDGLIDNYTSSGTRSHVYVSAGTYTITVYGSFTQFGTGGFLSGPNRITKVLDWGCVGITSLPYAFVQAINLTDVPSSLPAGVTNLYGTFRDAASFNDPDVASWNTSSVTDMRQTFMGATAFNQNIGNWNTSAVTNMTSMFQNASTFNQDLSVWNTAAVTSFNSMFENASAFNQNISSWNTANVTDLRDVFLQAVAFNQPIGSWNTGKVTSMAYAFKGASSFNQNIGNWNTALVTDMSFMFNAASVFNNGGSPDINNWNTGNVTQMGSMFYQAPAFNQPVGGWDMSKVTNVSAMFSCSGTPPGVFNQDISSWNTSSITTMYAMFVNQSNFNNGGNNTLGNWNTFNVLDMSFMFNSATNFNQNIGNWNTSVVKNMGSMFNGATSFNNGGSGTINSWNTSAVNNMTSMFRDALVFNQYINGWNTSAVTAMPSMFQGAAAFNQPIGDWNTSAVTNMSSMFENASSFNQDISGWNTESVTTMANMFKDATSFDHDLGSWNIDKVATMAGMFDGLCLSPTNYDGTLNGWAAQGLREPSVPFSAGFSYRTSAGTASWTALAGSGWIITDGGLDTDVSLSSATGTNNQTVAVNASITDITYNFPGTAPAVFKGLPPGVTGTVSGGVAIISGAPTTEGVYNYQVDGCGSLTGTITVSMAALPVSLLDFSSRAADDKVMLSWKTSFEQNNYGFEIERSADARTWCKIGFVPGQVNSSVLTRYSYNDLAPLKGTSYYRLKQIDLDGKFSFSRVARVDNVTNGKVTIWPNPVNDLLNVEINQRYRGETIYLSVIDMNGRMLLNRVVAPGKSAISTSGWSKGIYMVMLQGTNGIITTQKILKK